MRDYQRQALYAWEQRVLQRTKQMTAANPARAARDACVQGFTVYADAATIRPMEQLQALHDEILRLYGLPADVRVLHRKQASRAFARHDNTTTLPSWGLCKWVVIHEAAHHVIRGLFKWRVPAHGPEFAAIYGYLLNRFLDIPFAAMVEVLPHKGVRLQMCDPLRYAPEEVEARKVDVEREFERLTKTRRRIVKVI